MGAPVLLGYGHDRALGEGLAEQLLDAVAPSPDAAVVDLLADGVLSRALQRRLSPRGRLVIVEPRGAVAAIPLPGDSVDQVLCMLTLGFGDAGSLITEARRVLREGGGLAVLTYDDAAPPAVEAPLVVALRAHGVESAYLRCLLPHGAVTRLAAAGFRSREVRDVARFDSPRHYWEVMVTGRPLGVELGAVDAPVLRSIQGAVVSELAQHTAADDTLRIPTTASLLFG